MNTQPVYLYPPALVSALGTGIDAHLAALFAAAPPPLTFSAQWTPGKPYAFAQVTRALRPFPTHLPALHHSRNNQLLWDALTQIEAQIDDALSRFGRKRVAVIIGTSTSGVDENIPLFQHVAQGGSWGDIPFKQSQQIHCAPAESVAALYGIRGLTYGVSTACTSGARALISAARLLRQNRGDAVICGGVDTLSPLTINGFAALEVLSPGIANPFSRHRDGINIGEAAAAFVMRRDADDSALPLLGYGASSDAWHMSSPRPDGSGALRAFRAALGDLPPAAIGWINLHGTGTPLNDSMESHSIAACFGLNTLATSTKPYTGHTLGAAGALEAALLWAMISRSHNPQGRLPAQYWDGERDPELPALALTDAHSRWPDGRRIGMSSSFAFGGNNSVLTLGEAHA